jgi:hypothetical protein
MAKRHPSTNTRIWPQTITPAPGCNQEITSAASPGSGHRWRSRWAASRWVRSEVALLGGRRIRFNYWSALTDATSVKGGKLRLQVLISELEHRGYDAELETILD